MDTRQVELIEQYTDMFQIGARNMQNFDLLREVGKTRKPVLLKRGLAATVKDWLLSAEYVLSQGNRGVILCERGIKTFEDSIRYTLDITSIPVARKLSHLPIIVDPSHAAGKRDYVAALAAAGMAAGRPRHDHRGPLQPQRSAVRRPAGAAAGDVQGTDGPARQIAGDAQGVPAHRGARYHGKIARTAKVYGKDRKKHGTHAVRRRQLEDEHDQGLGRRAGQGRGRGRAGDLRRAGRRRRRRSSTSTRSARSSPASNVLLGAQDAYFEKNGAFTGEISVEMLKDLGVKFCLTGHSERRHVLKETPGARRQEGRRGLRRRPDPRPLRRREARRARREQDARRRRSRS